MHALLIADRPDETAVLSLLLQLTGLTTSTGRDLDRALAQRTAHPADLIVVALQTQDPRAVVRRVRATSMVPLVLIVEVPHEDQLIALLNTGADLVVPRPYNVYLLSAQIRALLRRAQGVAFTELPTLTVGPVTVDPAARSVQVAGSAPQRLTSLEFRLLYTLMLHRDQVLSPDMIVARVWVEDSEGDQSLVRGLVSRLRAKVEPVRHAPRYIVTIPGQGYVFHGGESPDT